MVIQHTTSAAKLTTSRTMTSKHAQADSQSRVAKFITILLLTISGLLNIQNAMAEPRYYHVEVIIFDDADERYLGSEQWPKKPEGLPETVPAVVSANKTTYPIVSSISTSNTSQNTITNHSDIFQNVEPSILLEEAKRLSGSRHYQMLFYSSWTQEGLDSKRAIKINLDQLTNHANVRTKNIITGELKVVLARYLHLYTELEFIREHKVKTVKEVFTNQDTNDKQFNGEGINEQEIIEQPANAENNLARVEEQVLVDYYPIHTHRRMRSKVLHYIDHPLVGILVQINPVEKVAVNQ